MPQVPKYEALQVTPGSQPNARFEAPTAPNFANQQGQQIQQAAGAISQLANAMAQQANHVRVDDALNTYVKVRTDFQAEALQLKGRNALERPDGKSLADEYGDRLQKAAAQLSGDLGNSVQRDLFQRHAKQIQQQVYASLSSHMVDQQRVFRAETQKATIDIAVNQGVLLWGDTAARQQSLDAITTTIDQMAAHNGWDKATKDVAMSDAVSRLHAGAMHSMVKGGMASMARDYYDAHSASMSLQARTNMQGVLHEAVALQVAEQSADNIWRDMGPNSPSDAVRLFDMEQAMRKQLHNHPDALRKGIDGLRQRAQAFNAQQTEIRAQNIAGVWKLIDSDTPMSEVQLSDPWLALSDTERHTLLKQAAGDESLRLRANGDKYLTITDPNVLSQMSRAQVEALRGEFGMEATLHLLTKWDTLQQPGKVGEARLDTEDFSMVADDLGLRPFASGQSEKRKRALGELKFRMEQLIDLQQRAHKRPLDRQEKMTLMRNEMAKKVTVDPWYWYGEEVPVVQLTANQIKNVVVPAAERTKIAEALKIMHERHPNDSRYRPTEENLRRLYLESVSPAGKLIPNAN